MNSKKNASNALMPSLADVVPNEPNPDCTGSPHCPAEAGLLARRKEEPRWGHACDTRKDPLLPPMLTLHHTPRVPCQERKRAVLRHSVPAPPQCGPRQHEQV